MTTRSRKSRLTEPRGRTGLRRGGGAVLVVTAAVALWACAGGAKSPESSAEAPGATANATEPVETAVSTSVRRFASNVNQAVGLAFDNRGRLLYAEKDSGRIVRVSGGKKRVLARLGVTGGAEAGLLGLAGDRRGNVYAYYTTGAAGCPNPTRSSGSGGDIDAHCVWSFSPSRGRLRAKKLVFSSNHPSSARNHVGGGLHFGPDGALYLGLGDLGENSDPDRGPGRAQSLAVPFGKILRLNPNATNKGASGNPKTCGNAANSSQRSISDGRIFACGLRNPYSFDWDSRKRLWAIDVGDSCDELNIIRSGVNYGWEPPRTDCAGSGAGRVIKRINGTPSGVAISKSRAAGSWRNDVFYCLFLSSELVRYDSRTRRATPVRSARGKCGYDLIARGNYIYMSDGNDIHRMRIRR